MAKALQEKFPNAHLTIAPGQWLVFGPGTAKEISDQLGITAESPTINNGIVLAISGYYGRASNNIWEWIAAHWK